MSTPELKYFLHNFVKIKTTLLDEECGCEYQLILFINKI